ncbi:hypothetical protein MKW94_016127 [Papaver nudicaule]|uniref:Uncharacterized protein n=1 Tax=Papaver nudicaule TaxID=74823 RepID=A0AA42B3S2_PAPNU|nr:hypothetical protein [Papaver nudicaule]
MSFARVVKCLWHCLGCKCLETFKWSSCLKRCGKSCRLRWLNYLRPNLKHGEFTDAEDRIICSLFATIGSRWSIIAAQLPGGTDNDIKNYSTFQTRSFMELLDESINPRLSSNYIMNNIHNTSKQRLIGSIHSNLLMIGTTSGTNDQLSCSSSDGKYENGNSYHFITTSRSNGTTKNGEMMMGNYNYNGGGAVVLAEENQKFIFINDHLYLLIPL